MAKFVVSMNLSLDGYVDHDRFAPDPELFRHWIQQVGAVSDSLYGRRIYELMRYWEVDQTEWSADERVFAEGWRRQRKWVVSRGRPALGPNASLITGDVEAEVRALKARLTGEVEVSGTVLMESLDAMGLIDEFRLYYHPVVLGRGRPFFPAARPALRLVESARIGPEVIRLTYVPR